MFVKLFIKLQNITVIFETFKNKCFSQNKHMLELSNETYTAIIQENAIILYEDNKKTDISFREIQKMKFSSKKLKIFLKNDKLLCFDVTKKEMEEMQKIIEHKIDSDIVLNDIKCTIRFNFKNLVFYTYIDELSITSMKMAIIKRISLHFYPAVKAENIYISDFQQFKFFVIDENNKSELLFDDDVIAASVFYNGKLDIDVVDMDNK